MPTTQSSLSFSKLSAVPSTAVAARTKAMRLGVVFVVNLTLALLLNLTCGSFVRYQPGLVWRLALEVGAFGPRCFAVCSGMLTVLAIRRQWLGFLLGGLVGAAHAYICLLAPWFYDPYFTTYNFDVYIGETLYIGLFGFGAHAITRLARLGCPLAIDFPHRRIPGKRQFHLFDLLVATATAAAYLASINALPLNPEPFTPHLGITLSVFFIAATIGPLLWALLRDRPRTAPWWWIVPWTLLFPPGAELLINACVFQGSDPYYWVENRGWEIMCCIAIALIDGLLLRTLGFRWQPPLGPTATSASASSDACAGTQTSPHH